MRMNVEIGAETWPVSIFDRVDFVKSARAASAVNVMPAVNRR